MPDFSNLLEITELAGTQEERSVTVNEAIAKLEAGAGLFPALDVNLNTPAGSPSEGDVYVLGAAPTGAWSGHGSDIAVYYNASWRFMPARSGLMAYAVNEDAYYRFATAYGWELLNVGAVVAVTESFIIACSDETTALTTGTAKATFRIPYAFTLTDVRASVTTAATGGTLLTVDVNEGGSSILSTKLTFDASEKTTTTAATPRVISDASLANDAEITIDIDAIGSTIAGAGLKVTLIGQQ